MRIVIRTTLMIFSSYLSLPNLGFYVSSKVRPDSWEAIRSCWSS